MKRIIFLVIALLATSCSMLPPQVPTTIKERLAVGSTLKLNQSLQIPEDRLYIYIQNGRVMPIKNFNTVDVYSPYCMLYLKEETRQPHTVMPDKFTITKIIEWEGYYSLRNRYQISRLVKVATERDAGIDIIMYATILSLHSDKQPDIKQMVCGHWDEQSIVEPLTLEQLKTALGSLMTIEAKGR